MHELGLAKKLLAQAIAAAARAGCNWRSTANRFARIAAQAVELELRLLAQGTIAEGVSLRMESAGAGAEVSLVSIDVP